MSQNSTPKHYYQTRSTAFKPLVSTLDSVDTEVSNFKPRTSLARSPPIDRILVEVKNLEEQEQVFTEEIQVVLTPPLVEILNSHKNKTMTEPNVTLQQASAINQQPIFPKFINPDNFTPGETNCLSFLRKYERCAEANHWTDANKIAHLGNFLTGNAYTWYEAYKNNAINESKKWGDIIKDFQKYFGGFNTLLENRNQLRNRKQQRQETVLKFYYDLLELANQIIPEVPITELVDYFKEGIQPGLKTHFILICPSMDELTLDNFRTAVFKLADLQDSQIKDSVVSLLILYIFCKIGGRNIVMVIYNLVCVCAEESTPKQEMILTHIKSVVLIFFVGVFAIIVVYCLLKRRKNRLEKQSRKKPYRKRYLTVIPEEEEETEHDTSTSVKDAGNIEESKITGPVCAQGDNVFVVDNLNGQQSIKSHPENRSLGTGNQED